MQERTEINLVWLKRDLRLTDHEPLFLAEQSGLPYIIIYNFDPKLISAPEVSLRHLQFQYHSVLELNQKLKTHNRKIIIMYGEMGDFLQDLSVEYDIKNIYSYQETGTLASWKRDKNVKEFCNSSKINWVECQYNGVQRGRKNRDGWDKTWYALMHQKTIKNNISTQEKEISAPKGFNIPAEEIEAWSKYSNSFQKAGSTAAWKYLESFMQGRGEMYQKHISKPALSRKSCSRLSVYLAWGNLSIKQTYQYVMSHPNYTNAKRAYNSFLQRLKWHDHFIQKFEMECEYEFSCVNRGYELLEYNKNEEYIKAWKEGKTGVPLVDANMRCLHETGWINFRMRAMLVSFFCHHLGQNWKDGAHFLAKQFLDYEPGIHFPQFQMQAGTTGTNIVRVYNPVKQALDHDSDASFIKKWVPELKGFTDQLALHPWKITDLDLQMMKPDKVYPKPIVNLSVAVKENKKRLWAHKQHPLVLREAARIVQKHTRNK